MIEMVMKKYDSKKIVIYGAHLVALECYRYIVNIGMGNCVVGFAVSDLKDNPADIEGMPVRTIQEYRNYAEDVLVVIAMPKKYHSVVEQYARELGFKKFETLSLEDMSKLKGNRLIQTQQSADAFPFVIQKSGTDFSWLDAYVDGNDGKVRFKFPTLFYLDEKMVIACTRNKDLFREYRKTLGNLIDVHDLVSLDKADEDRGKSKNIMQIYMAFGSSEIDIVRQTAYDDWILPLQVGNENKGRRFGVFFDDEYEGNIADNNSLFAEMTGAHWIWKMAPKSEYKGLCHYRRHFILNQAEVYAIKENNIDVLLSTPRYAPGGIKDMFLAETPVKKYVMDSILYSIEVCSGEDLDEFERYLESEFYYPNNMVVAKSEIYDSYCAWIFPILFRMMELDIETGYGHEGDRHIAYAAELLTSYYFIKHRDKIKIAITDYCFLG